MKKFEIIVTTKQGEKKVSVYVDSETAAMLKTCPEEVRLVYLKEIYKEQLLERKETRRHVSLEKTKNKPPKPIQKCLAVIQNYRKEKSVVQVLNRPRIFDKIRRSDFEKKILKTGKDKAVKLLV